MPSSLTKENKPSLVTLSLESKPNSKIWNEAIETWDEAAYTWDQPNIVVALENKPGAVSLNLESKP